MVTDSSGNKLAYHSYDPYGNPLDDTGSSFQFKGEQLDQGGMYFMRARYYDPTTGRFIAKDPVEGYNTDPQTQNGYSFVDNNPINLADPSGKAWWWAVDAAGTAADAYSLYNAVCNGNLGGAALSGVSLAIPGVSVGAIKLVGQGAKYSDNQLRHFEDIYNQGGRSSLQKSRSSIEKNLIEHQQKLEKYKKEGGYTSSVESEISNFQKELNAIDEVLRRHK